MNHARMLALASSLTVPFAPLAPLAPLALAPACAKTVRPDGQTGMLAEGAVAPDFVAKDGAGASFRLSDGAGHERVGVYFYPKDETPGCTKEACAFRDAFAEYQKRGILVFGVSRDTEESHRRFREQHQLPFFLAADENGDIQRAYGAPGHLGVTSRVTFLVDPGGKITRVWEKVDPAAHASEILGLVK